MILLNLTSTSHMDQKKLVRWSVWIQDLDTGENLAHGRTAQQLNSSKLIKCDKWAYTWRVALRSKSRVVLSGKKKCFALEMWQYNVSLGCFNAEWWFCKSMCFASDVLEDIIMPWGNFAGNQNLFPKQKYLHYKSNGLSTKRLLLKLRTYIQYL